MRERAGDAPKVAKSWRDRLRPSPSAALVISGSSWSFVLQVLSKLSILVVMTIAARALGVRDFGTFAALQALGLLSAAVWDAGFSQLVLRDVAAQPDLLRQYLSAGIKAKVVLLPVFFSVYLLGCITLGLTGIEQALGAAIVGLGSLFTGFTSLLSSSLQAEFRFKETALTTSMGRITVATLAASVLIWEMPSSFIALATASCVGEVVIGVFQLRAMRLSRLTIYDAATVRLAMQLQRRSVPYALNGFFVLVYNRLDIVLVTWFAGSVQAGLYGPASRIQDALSFVPATLTAALTPMFSRYLSDRRNVRTVAKTMFSVSLISFAVIISVLIVVWLAADTVIPIVLGNDFAASADATRIITLALVFSAVAQPFFSFVVALDRAMLLNAAYGTSLVVSIAGHALVDPRFGALGASWVAVSRDVVGAAIGITIALLLLKARREQVRETLSTVS